MYKIIPALLILSFVPYLGIAQEGEHYRFWRDLREADQEFSQAATEQGRTDAFLAALGQGSVLFREGPVNARELYERNQTLYSLDQLTWRCHFIDVSLDGDLGVTVGPNFFVPSRERNDEVQETYNHMVNVWRKVNGEWKLMVDIVVRVPGFLSLDVEPKYSDTLALMDETARSELTVDNDMQGLLDADVRFGSSINFRGGQRAWLRYAMINSRVYLPGMAPSVGTEAASSAYGRYMDSRVTATNPLSVTPNGGYMATSKEMGYTYGVMTTNSAEGGANFRTNYLRVWRYTNNNEWKVAMEFLSPY